jgi:hypothetical protein
VPALSEVNATAIQLAPVEYVSRVCQSTLGLAFSADCAERKVEPNVIGGAETFREVESDQTVHQR